MRAQLSRTTQDFENLNELHNVLAETNETRLQLIRQELEANPRQGARLIGLRRLRNAPV
jgi:hypothetical protein